MTAGKETSDEAEHPMPLNFEDEKLFFLGTQASVVTESSVEGVFVGLKVDKRMDDMVGFERVD